jgi:predicted ATPase
MPSDRLTGSPQIPEVILLQALSVDQILERLDDSIHLLVGGSRTAPTRQQTLRATLDWSYGLLGDGERAVFRRLAVFAGTFSLDAAEAVCAHGDIASSAVLDQLQQLIDKSLVVVEVRDGQARYRLLEPVRQYAQEHLATYGEQDAAHRRHAQCYLAFAEARAHDTNLGGPRRFTAAAELEGEYANIRAVLAWAVATGEAQVGLRLAGSLNFCWQLYGSTNEGLAWLRQLLALPGAAEPTTARAWALLTGIWLTMVAGDFTTARRSCQEALALARQVDEPSLEWMTLHFSGVVDGMRGELAAAETYLRQAVVCAHAAQEPAWESQSLDVLAMIACEQRDYPAAQSLAEQAVYLARTAGDAWSEGWALGWLGRAALGRGALEDARAALEAGLSVTRQLGQPASLTVFILNTLGEVGTASGQLEQARAWLVTSFRRQDRGANDG